MAEKFLVETPRSGGRENYGVGLARECRSIYPVSARATLRLPTCAEYVAFSRVGKIASRSDVGGHDDDDDGVI